MEQTAVEWLVEQCGLKPDGKLVIQAKQMEKEQIMDAASWTPEDGLSILSELAEEYYNKTFKSE